MASPQAQGFAQTVLGINDVQDAPPAWQEFLGGSGARVLCASFAADQPVLAFLNERDELLKTFDDLKKQGTIPAGFQRLIDAHFQDAPAVQNEVLLNRGHRLVQRALEQKTSSPLASVLRLLVQAPCTGPGPTCRTPCISSRRRTSTGSPRHCGGKQSNLIQ